MATRSREEALVDQLVETEDDETRAALQSQMLEPSLDRDLLRQRLLREARERRRQKVWGTRGWVVATLGRLLDSDEKVTSAFARFLDESYESEPWVRYWALEGLWAGGSPLLGQALEDIEGQKDPHPLVVQLALAIRAQRGDERAIERLDKDLNDPDLLYPTLRALRIVPLPTFRSRVEAIRTEGKDKTLLWNARKALDRMAEATEGGTGNLEAENSKILKTANLDTGNLGTENLNAEILKTENLDSETERDGSFVRYSEDGQSVFIGEVELPVRQWEGSRSGDPRIWLAVLTPDEHARLWNPASSGAGLIRLALGGSESPLHASGEDLVLLSGTSADGVEGIVRLATVAPRGREGSPRHLDLVPGDPVEPPIDEKTRIDAGLNLRFDPGSLVEVGEEEWAILSALILFSNPEATLPAVKAPADPSAEVVRVNVPESLAVGARFTATLEVRNTGNITWPGDQTFRVATTIQPRGEKPTPVDGDWEGWYREAVPPGGRIVLEGPEHTAPERPGTYLVEWEFYGDTSGTSFSPVSVKAEVEVLAAEVEGEPESEPVEERPPEPAAPPPVHVSEADLEGIGVDESKVDESKVEESEVEEPEAEETGRETAVRPTVVSHEVSRVIAFYEPPREESLLTLKMTDSTATLRFGNQEECVSPFKLDDEKLRELEADPLEYGRALFEMAINDDRQAEPLLATKHGYDEARKRTQGEMRFELVLQSPRLQSLAWERLRDDSSFPPFAVSERTPFYRRVRMAEPKLAAPPLKVLVAVSNPAGLGSKDNRLLADLTALDVFEQRQLIEPELERLQEAGVVEYRILPEDPQEPLTFEALSDALQEETHVLHLMAHGLRVQGRYHIVIERAAGGRPFVEAAGFAEPILGASSELRLAVLQACSSGEVADDETSNMALGTRLVRAGFPAVISMRRKLGLATAKYFNSRFYFHLARSEHVEMALAATRFNIYQRKIDGERSWSVPVLHLGVKTGRLFGVDDARALTLGDEEPELPRPETAARRRSGALDEVADVVRGAAAGGPLDDRDVEAISKAAVRAATEVEPLAKPQDRNRMSLQMPRLVQLRGGALAAYVKEETGLDVPPAAYAQMASALNTGKHIVLIGPPGTGKTSLAHAVAEFAQSQGFSPGTIPTTASADWTTFDTVGGYVPVSAERLDFRPGIFLRAIASGEWLVLDEINRAEIDKAVGELFTVLSGQQVDLPYRIGGRPVRLLPARKEPHPRNWVPEGVRGDHDYDYVVHPNWRILATMNVYDKSSLFGLSFAFMRRFAFIDVGIPDEVEIFRALRERWASEHEPLVSELLGGDDAARVAAGERSGALLEKMAEIFAPEGSLMKGRELGPAIAKDMIRYVFDRFEQSSATADLVSLLGEAFLLYAVPQLDGLDRLTVREVYSYLDEVFDGVDTGNDVLDRLTALYPHVRDWPERRSTGAPGEGPGNA